MDLDRLSDWCKVNRLPLNNNKCKKITISHKRNEFTFDYVLDGDVLEDGKSVMDLGVLIDKKLSFNPHIDMIVQSALRLLGFISRTTLHFKQPSSLLTLYNSMVKSRLQYASVIWSPFYAIHIDRLEKVQRRFLKLSHFRTYGQYPPHGFDQLDMLNSYNILPLERCRIQNNLCFIFKLCNNLIECTQLLNKVNFAVPLANTRQCREFYQPLATSNLQQKAPIYRSCFLWNNLANYNNITIDLHNCSLDSLKRALRVGNLEVHR